MIYNAFQGPSTGLTPLVERSENSSSHSSQNPTPTGSKESSPKKSNRENSPRSKLADGFNKLSTSEPKIPIKKLNFDDSSLNAQLFQSAPFSSSSSSIGSSKEQLDALKSLSTLLFKDVKASGNPQSKEPSSDKKPKPTLKASSSVSRDIRKPLTYVYQQVDALNIIRRVEATKIAEKSNETPSPKNAATVCSEQIVSHFLNNPQSLQFVLNSDKNTLSLIFKQNELNLTALLEMINYDAVNLMSVDEERYIQLLKSSFSSPMPLTKRAYLKNSFFPTPAYFENELAAYISENPEASVLKQLSYAERLAINVYTGKDGAVINLILNNQIADIAVAFEKDYSDHLAFLHMESPSPKHKTDCFSLWFGSRLATIAMILKAINQMPIRADYGVQSHPSRSDKTADEKMEIGSVLVNKGFTNAYCDKVPCALDKLNTLFIGMKGLLVAPFSQQPSRADQAPEASKECVYAPMYFQISGHVHSKNEDKHFFTARPYKSPDVPKAKQVAYLGDPQNAFFAPEIAPLCKHRDAQSLGKTTPKM